jgi:hypothetical protein
MEAMRLASESFETSHPLSRAPKDEEVFDIGASLLQVLGLKGELLVMHAGALASLRAERYFRRRWWSGGEDIFRRAIHECKYLAHAQPERNAAVTHAWARMKSRVTSSSWRKQIRKLSQGQSQEQMWYLQLLFSAAQQLWTRAARWEAALAPASNPFILMTQLFERWCWPLGWNSGKLHICCLTQEGEILGKEFFPDFRPLPPSPRQASVFLSAPFSEGFAKRVSSAISDRGMDVVHGWIDEQLPTEPQLGKRIMDASAVVGIFSLDPDFGLPWWGFQELDFAEACGRPVALLGKVAPSILQGDANSFVVHNDSIEEGFWEWLKCNL